MSINGPDDDVLVDGIWPYTRGMWFDETFNQIVIGLTGMNLAPTALQEATWIDLEKPSTKWNRHRRKDVE